MNWEDKMDQVVYEVLGEGYHVRVIDRQCFSICKDGDEILKRSTVKKLDAHWRQELRELLLYHFDNQINKTLSKY